jgi:hypothetical protein
MTSKIKVDNIENQCGGAVVTKCGATTTIAGTNINATTVTATNVVGSTAVKSDNIQAADGGNLINQCGTTITLGASGDTINLASGASQTGFGRTGTVDWDTTPKTATFTAVSGNGYFVNTTSGAITVTLPAGSAGDIVSLADYAATWQTNAVTITPNGTDKIGGANENAILSTEGQSVTFVYTDSTQGWLNTMDSTSNVRASSYIEATGGTITESGDYKIHIFTGPGTFCVSSLAPGPSGNPNVAEYLVVAGGGGGGMGVSDDSAGGGGAGGFRTRTALPCASPLNAPTGITLTASAFPITVGAGGADRLTPGTGNAGNNSIFSSIISAGGGAGGFPTGGAGGSGGGTLQNPGGAGNTPPTSPPQGNTGGNSICGPGPQSPNAGGGGGAGAVGANAPRPFTSGGDGGAGSFIPTGFVGPTAPSYGETGPAGRYFAGGGAGGISPSRGGQICASGGLGGGGDTTLTGTANTGGGGGASDTSAPGGRQGGSGIVMIRYKFQ